MTGKIEQGVVKAGDAVEIVGLASETGSASVLDGVQMAMPGDGVRLSIALKQPIAISDGDHFAIGTSRTISTSAS